MTLSLTKRATLLTTLTLLIATVSPTAALAANDHANDKAQCVSQKDARPWHCIEDSPGLLIASPARGEDEPEVAPETARAERHAANAAQLETLRAHRDVNGDATKQLQTAVNQLNDAASQQGNIATAILQQLSGILTLIFR